MNAISTWDVNLFYNSCNTNDLKKKKAIGQHIFHNQYALAAFFGLKSLEKSNIFGGINY